MIDARRLGTLATLDRLGTVAAVAEELHLTPSGVSMQLATLERETGLVLTERRGRRIALTAAGKLLAAHGAHILDQLALASMEVEGLHSGIAGRYRIAAFPSAAGTIVARAWHELARSSAIELELTTMEPEDAIRSLSSGEADIAVTHSYSNVPRQLPAGVHVVEIGVEEVRLAIRSDDLLAHDIVPLADLADRAWITAPEHLTCHQMTERACGLAGFRPHTVARSVDFRVQTALVASGVGVALIPVLGAGHLPAEVELVPTEPAVQRHIFAAWRVRSATDPGVRAIFNALRCAADSSPHLRRAPERADLSDS